MRIKRVEARPNKHSATEQTFAHGNVPAGVSLFNRSSLYRDPFHEIIANGEIGAAGYRGSSGGEDPPGRWLGPPSGKSHSYVYRARLSYSSPIVRRFGRRAAQRPTVSARFGFIFPVADHVAREIANEQTLRGPPRFFGHTRPLFRSSFQSRRGIYVVPRQRKAKRVTSHIRASLMRVSSFKRTLDRH